MDVKLGNYLLTACCRFKELIARKEAIEHI